MATRSVMGLMLAGGMMAPREIQGTGIYRVLWRSRAMVCGIPLLVAGLLLMAWSLPARAQSSALNQPTLTLSAAKTEVASGKTTRLSWVGVNVDRCVASGSWSGVYEGRTALKGSFTTPALTSRENGFTLSCTGPGGSTRASVTVLALPKPEITLTATPESLIPGQSVTLNWTSTDAASCKGSGSGFTGDKALSGQEVISDLTKGKKKFSLSCKGAGGTTKVTTEVQVVPVPTLSFSARKAEIAEGQSAQLKWRAKDATRCEAGGDWSGEQSLSGSFASSPLTQDQSYTLSCEGANGRATETVTVRVIPAPTINLTIDRTRLVEGDSLLIAWSSSDAQDCKASGAWRGTKTLSGNELLNDLRAGEKKVTLRCSGAGGKAEVTESFTVLRRPTLRFKVNRTQADKGGTVRLSWSAKNVDSCEASGAWSGPRDLTGSFSTASFDRNGQYRYTLSCDGAGGSISETLTVRVGSGFPEISLTATPSLIKPGERTTLEWSSEDADRCFAAGAWQGSRSLNGSQSILLAQAGEFIFSLICENSSGSSEATAEVTVDGLEYSVSTSAVSFDPVFIGNSSDVREVVLRNRSRASIGLSSVGLVGSDASQFVIDTDCGRSVPASGVCRVSVRFAPTSPGSKRANLRFVTDGDPSVFDVALAGRADPGSVEFSVVIPSFVQTDSDVNDPEASYAFNNSAASAQFLTWPFAVGGFVARAGASLPDAFITRADPEDYFRVRLAEGQAVVLEIDQKTEREDLDIYLFAMDGTLVDSSIRPAGVAREFVVAPSAADYFVLIEAFAGAAKYFLLSDSSTTEARLGSSLLSRDFLPGQAVVRLAPAARRPLDRELSRTRQTLTLSAELGEPALALGVISGDLDSVFAAALPQEEAVLPFGRFKDIAQQQKYETLKSIKQLASRADFEFIEPNFVMSAFVEPNDPDYSRQRWHYDMIQAAPSWDIFQGSDEVVVAVIDSGVARHPDLVENLLGGYDFVSSDPLGDGDGRDNDPSDPGITRSGSAIRNSHGTHVAGTVAARGNNALGVTGVAWRTKILPVRALDATGRGSTSDIVDAIRYAAGLGPIQPPKKADIINLSLGSDSTTCGSAFQQAADEARAAGVIVVAAAGNSALDFVGSPANCRGVIGVSALGPQKQLSSYSNSGSATDVAGPGGDGLTSVFSTQIRRENDGPINFNYAGSQGTSMATPHVAGVLALMKGVNRALSPESVDALLVNGSLTDDIGAEGRDLQYGYGAINTLRAINASQGPLPVTSPFDAFFSPGRLDFGDVISNIVVTVSMTGETSVFERFTISGPTAFLDLASAVRLGANTFAFTFSVRRDAIPVGSTISNVVFEAQLSNGSRRFSLPVLVTRNPTEYVGDAGTMYGLLFDPVARETVGAAKLEARGPRINGRIEAEQPGDYWLVVGADVDNDFFICGLGESCAAYPISSGLWQAIPVRSALRGYAIEATYISRLASGELASAGINLASLLPVEGISRRVGKRNLASTTGQFEGDASPKDFPQPVEIQFLDIELPEEKSNSASSKPTMADERVVFPVDVSPVDVEPKKTDTTALETAPIHHLSLGSAVRRLDRFEASHSGSYSRYVLQSSLTSSGEQHWSLKSQSSSGLVQGEISLPPTAPVVWRLPQVQSQVLPATGWIKECGDTLYTVIDGYGLTLGRYDSSLLRSQFESVGVLADPEAILVSELSCEPSGLRVSGITLPVSADSPSAVGVVTNAVRFSMLLSNGLDSAATKNEIRTRSLATFELASMCVSPPVERAPFCRELYRGR